MHGSMQGIIFSTADLPIVVYQFDEDALNSWFTGVICNDLGSKACPCPYELRTSIYPTKRNVQDTPE